MVVKPVAASSKGPMQALGAMVRLRLGLAPRLEQFVHLIGSVKQLFGTMSQDASSGFQ